MFSIPRTNVVESDAGFSVEVLGRTGMQYCENGRAMKIDSEVLMGTKAMAVYSYSFSSWLPPHHAEPVDDATKARIAENLRAAFRFRGVEIDII
jgi:hypothetical protein